MTHEQLTAAIEVLLDRAAAALERAAQNTSSQASWSVNMTTAAVLGALADSLIEIRNTSHD